MEQGSFEGMPHDQQAAMTLLLRELPWLLDLARAEANRADLDDSPGTTDDRDSQELRAKALAIGGWAAEVSSWLARPPRQRPHIEVLLLSVHEHGSPAFPRWMVRLVRPGTGTFMAGSTSGMPTVERVATALHTAHYWARVTGWPIVWKVIPGSRTFAKFEPAPVDGDADAPELMPQMAIDAHMRDARRKPVSTDFLLLPEMNRE